MVPARARFHRVVGETMKTEFGLGRLPAPDKRDKNFPMRSRLADEAPLPVSKYWWNAGARLDQGDTGTCVGHGWVHFMENSPITRPGTLDPIQYYRDCCRLDEFPGNDSGDLNYGSSVRGGAKVGIERQLLDSYTWAWDFETALRCVLTKSPVVLGVNWYTGMFYPKVRNNKPMIEVTGGVEGGHCVVWDGANQKLRICRILNSWGPQWGYKGMAYISFEDMARLISEDGEACLPIERKAA